MTNNEQEERDSAPRGFFRELTRRHVVQIGIAYGISAWLIVEIASVVLPAFNAPDWALQGVIVLAVAGLPVALVVSWIFDITPSGIVRTDQVSDDEQEPEELEATSEFSERRQLTVLFGELVWQGVGEELDPEDIREALPRLREGCSAVASRYDGYVASWLSDRFVIYFGYPEARENDARHAVSSGIAINEGTRRLSERFEQELGLSVSVNIGIDTGTVVIESSSDPTEEIQVLGSVVSNAEWLRTLGSSDVLKISETTSSLTSGYFYQQEIGRFAPQGSGQESPVFAVSAESGARTRLEAAGEFLALTGRDHEFGLLRQRWEQALEGQGQVVVISGEAGIGKSRLLHELKTHVAGDLRAWLTECICSPDRTNRPFHAIVEMLHKSWLGSSDSDEEQDPVRIIEGILSQFAVDLDEAMPLLLDQLDLPPDERYPSLQLAPQLQKVRTMELLLSLLLARAEQQPLLLVVEDLHWADPSSLELISMVVSQVPSSRILAAFTTRQAQFEWTDLSHVTSIALTPLTSGDTARLVAATPGGEDLPATVVKKLVDNSQGNPLFTEELTRAVLASEQDMHSSPGNIEDLRIPATLQESLLARLDRLGGAAKAVARLAATIGREFTFELAARLAEVLGVSKLEAELENLVKADIIYQRGLPPTASYSFRHVLLQEAAYQSQLKKERETLHGTVAELLQHDFEGLVEKQPDLLARHLTAAGDAMAAIPYWKKAGDQALRRSANPEARNYLQTALDLLDGLPRSPDRDALELQLQTSLGPALMAVRGYSAPEVLHAYQRAEELSAQAVESPALAPVLFGLWTYHVVSGELPAALGFGNRLMSIAEKFASSDLLLESHVLLGVTMTHAGPVSEALEHLSAAIHMYSADEHGGHAFVYGQDPKMASIVYRGSAEWWLGHPDKGGRSVDEAIEFARELRHANSLAFALASAARCHLKRGDYGRCIDTGAEAVEISERHGFPVWRTMGEFLCSAARYLASGEASLVPEMEENVAACIAVGNSLSTAYYRTILANACIDTGDLDRAREHLEDADRVLELHGTDADEAEVIRTRGRLCWALKDAGLAPPTDPEVQLREALSHAIDAGAASWRLQAAVTLGQYLGRKGDGAGVGEILDDSLALIDEGESLPMISEARALRQELEQQRQ